MKKKFDAFAETVLLAEIKKHGHQFNFDFVTLFKKGNIVYKLYGSGDEGHNTWRSFLMRFFILLEH